MATLSANSFAEPPIVKVIIAGTDPQLVDADGVEVAFVVLEHVEAMGQ